ncbi:N-acetyl-anhydromuramyl-L-alanine amidase AmpD [Streptacidiphilus sp. MAP12-20]|uniref:N-acetylmuramoyl-L-alanine amidase n=1 Tax=Streptacidiphilus sp. MAP12-20 TaxID=3156299 RepID=UPI003512CFF6
MKAQHSRKRSKFWIGATAALATSALVAGAVAEASSSTGPGSNAAAVTTAAPIRLSSSLQSEFASAAKEFHVPQALLLALSYQQSLWDSHQGQPSTTGNYNVMGLTQVTKADLTTPTGNSAPEADGQGDPRVHTHATLKAQPAAVAVDTSSAALHTLDSAARLIGRPAAALKSDTRQSIRGGAALLASYERKQHGSLPADPGQWYQAVAAFAHAGDAATAKEYADRVYQVMRKGVTRTTAENQVVSLAAEPSLAVSGAASSTTLARSGVAPLAATVTPSAAGPSFPVECPTGLSCKVSPAAYVQNSPTDISNYGNYALSNRAPGDGTVSYIVIHDTESTASSAINSFQSGTTNASAHYVVGQDGSVTQMVPTADMAWHANNKTINTHSIGIEHEGYALQNGSWYTPSEYQSSAKLVSYLAAKFGVPVDRQHIIGHDEVPGIDDTYLFGQHWDPGPYWDWSYYLTLVGAPLSGNDQAVVGGTVTIAPPSSTSYEPTLLGCGSSTTVCQSRPANFVYLYKGPSTGSGLFQDADYVANGRSSSTGTQVGWDWTDRATYGETFVVAGVSGDWTAIWYGGKQAWFYNPGGAYAFANNKPGAQLAVPAGSSAIQVFGRAYPDPTTAYASNPTLAKMAADPTNHMQLEPLSYSIQPGQAYLAGTLTTGDYYDSYNYYKDFTTCSTAGGCKYYTSSLQYYPISFNHRLAFVKASDVRLISPAAPATSTYVPVTPTRLLDTRYGIGAPKTPIGPGGEVALKIAGATAGTSTLPTSSITAVVLNVTATDATSSSVVTVYPDGSALPTVSNLNFSKGQTVPNLVTVRLGSNGSVRLRNAGGTVDLIADIAGYYVSGSGGARFVGYGPSRVLDTRYGIGAPKAAVGPGGEVALQVTGGGGVLTDSGVTAVVLNVTATSPSASSNLTVYPGQTTMPGVSNLNFSPAQTISNLVVVPVGSDGKVRLYNQAGTVQIIADLAGYFTTSGGSVFHTVSPVRVMDTRSGIGVRSGAVGAGAKVTLQVGAANGIPLNAKAVVLNVTAVAPTTSGFVTVFPNGTAMPGVSNINFATGQTLPNLVVVPVVNGRVDFFNAAGSVNLVADLTGFFAAG